MNEVSLRPGDMIIVTHGEITLSAILTKKTKKYWYYFVDGHLARVKKKKLWRIIDANSTPTTVIYGPPVKRRKKQRKTRTLDLHGIAPDEIDDRVRQFFNFIKLPCEIIIGDSPQNREIVQKIVQEYDWSCHQKNSHNFGSLIIIENN